MVITTRNGKSSDFTRELTVDYNFGANLAEAVELFGEEAVFNGFVADGKVAIQAIVRAGMKEDAEGKSLTDDEIIEKVANYKVGAAARKASDPMEKIKAMLAKMSPEQRAAILGSVE